MLVGKGTGVSLGAETGVPVGWRVEPGAGVSVGTRAGVLLGIDIVVLVGTGIPVLVLRAAAVSAAVGRGVVDRVLVATRAGVLLGAVTGVPVVWLVGRDVAALGDWIVGSGAGGRVDREIGILVDRRTVVLVGAGILVLVLRAVGRSTRVAVGRRGVGVAAISMGDGTTVVLSVAEGGVASDTEVVAGLYVAPGIDAREGVKTAPSATVAEVVDEEATAGEGDANKGIGLAFAVGLAWVALKPNAPD